MGGGVKKMEKSVDVVYGQPPSVKFTLRAWLSGEKKIQGHWNVEKG